MLLSAKIGGKLFVLVKICFINKTVCNNKIKVKFPTFMSLDRIISHTHTYTVCMRFFCFIVYSQRKIGVCVCVLCFICRTIFFLLSANTFCDLIRIGLNDFQWLARIKFYEMCWWLKFHYFIYWCIFSRLKFHKNSVWKLLNHADKFSEIFFLLILYIYGII